MIAVDTNVLVYAHRPEYPHHDVARELIRELAESGAQWAIAWPCLHEFYGVVTNPKIYDEPSTPEQVWDQIAAWSESPGLRLLSEAHSHLGRLRELTLAAATTGPQVHDARIAAICLSHGVSELITMDRDFMRFPALRTRSLLA